jgi:uncharacterized membrane protein YeaQ/YmgE (transglycosylase-associated protein family)
MQVFSGAVGGTVAGNARDTFNLGFLCNSMAGIVGGLLGGQILQFLLGMGTSAIDAGDLRNLFASVGGGGIGGAIVVAIVGWLTRSQQEESAHQ